MENNKNSGAFPVVNETTKQLDINIGLTKREYAAIKILSGMLSNPVYAENVRKASAVEILADAEQTVVLKAYSKLAIDFADALLEKLTKG